MHRDVGMAGRQPADQRAAETEARMTDEERFALVVAVMGAATATPVREDLGASAGYTPGVPRLGVPALRMTDAAATSFPAPIALGAAFDTTLARGVGIVLGREARARECNVVLGGGLDLIRDPRNGRTSECISEDPLHAATIVAEMIAGTQSQGVISTVKHYALSCNETNRYWLDAIIHPAAHRESDLLAFEIAIERAQPGAVITADNMINGEYAGASAHLIQDILRDTWGFRGWVMSTSLEQGDQLMWRTRPLENAIEQAYADGLLSKQRLSEMCRRILRTMFRFGVDTWGAPPKLDVALHHRIALEVARRGIVLLDNQGILPLPAETAARIAVIGDHAEGARSRLAALQRFLPHAQIEFDAGRTPAHAMLLARRCDLAVVFATRIEGAGADLADLSLPWGQDAVIEAVASANPFTVVVLETANPVAMPWRDRVKAIVQAWYPGEAGGRAIAEVLTGLVNPSGRLPLTFPADLSQIPRPQLPGLGTPWGTPTTIRYDEGADIGYRWFATRNHIPLFAFGHGLSYTRFEYSDLHVRGGDTVSVTFDVLNIGTRAGADVPQLYLVQPRRLLGFERVELAPGESRRVSLAVDPRLLARFDGPSDRWVLPPGTYRVAVGRSAVDLVLTGEAFVMQPQARRAM
jgi:beta-glucosidase